MYQSKITGIGDLALDFLAENMLVLFNDNAPAELAEISILHSIEEMERDIKVGDVLTIGNNSYVVTAIGNEANYTFRTMGHCSLKFNGFTEVTLPGEIELSGDRLPEIKIGDMLIIEFK